MAQPTYVVMVTWEKWPTFFQSCPQGTLEEIGGLIKLVCSPFLWPFLRHHRIHARVVSWQWCTRLDISVGTPKLVHSPYPWFQEETSDMFSLLPVPERVSPVTHPGERRCPYPWSRRETLSLSPVLEITWESVLLYGLPLGVGAPPVV